MIVKKIKKFLFENKKAFKKNEIYAPKFAGTSRSVEYEIDGLCKSYIKVTGWHNGEGFDIYYNTKVGKNWETKRIDLHRDEIDLLLAALDHMRYFGK